MEEILVNEKEYPDLIQNLPQANLPIDKVIGYLFQGENGQICFFDFEGDNGGFGPLPRGSVGDRYRG